jgi:small-conductance mechanosensitive channel
MESLLDARLFRIGDTEVTAATLVVALLILLVTWVASRLARTFVAMRLLGRTRLKVGVRYAIGRILGYVILVLGLLVALQTIGVNATMLAAFSAALGIGLGFGLQDIVKNFVAGLVLLIERPIEVGDRVVVGDATGEVVEIRARATIVRTNDEVDLIVPNSRFITDTVQNWSYGSNRVRHRIPVGVAYASDPEVVVQALVAAAGRSENVLKDPAPTVLLKGFGDSSLDFELRCWTRTLLHRQGAFRAEVNRLILEELSSRGIEIPFPQQDLHIRTAPESPPPAPAPEASSPARVVQTESSGGPR